MKTHAMNIAIKTLGAFQRRRNRLIYEAQRYALAQWRRRRA